MPPKKDDKSVPADTLNGFEPKETKLLAAAFVSLLGPDKYDYDLMATLTGNTAGSLKKMFPPVKRKAIEAHPSFASFLGAAPVTDGATGDDKKTIAKPGGRKRKATSEPDAEAPAKADEGKTENTEELGNGKKKASARGPGRPRGKKAKGNKGNVKAEVDDVKKEPTPNEDESNEDGKPEDEV